MLKLIYLSLAKLKTSFTLLSCFRCSAREQQVADGQVVAGKRTFGANANNTRQCQICLPQLLSARFFSFLSSTALKQLTKKEEEMGTIGSKCFKCQLETDSQAKERLLENDGQMKQWQPFVCLSIRSFVRSSSRFALFRDQLTF